MFLWPQYSSSLNINYHSGLTLYNYLYSSYFAFNKYTWERVERVGLWIVVDRALMDYLLISRIAGIRLLDVHVHRGSMRGTSDHYLVEGRVRVTERWILIRGAAEQWIHIKVREVRKK